jgi:hypothetical protein
VVFNGQIHVPVLGLDVAAVDRLLGLVVEGALFARQYAASPAGGEEPPPAGWLAQ